MLGSHPSRTPQGPLGAGRSQVQILSPRSAKALLIGRFSSFWGSSFSPAGNQGGPSLRVGLRGGELALARLSRMDEQLDFGAETRRTRVNAGCARAAAGRRRGRRDAARDDRMGVRTNAGGADAM